MKTSTRLARCNALAHGGAGTFQQAQKGTHHGFTGLQDLVTDTSELVRGVLRQ